MKKTISAGGLCLVAVLAAALTPASSATAETRYGQSSKSGTTGTTHIGSLYQYANKQGDQLYIMASGGCDAETRGDPEYYVSDLSKNPYLSNNGTSSFTDFNGCDTKLFDGTNGTGTSFGYYNGGSTGFNVSGSFDNKASSVQWS